MPLWSACLWLLSSLLTDAAGTAEPPALLVPELLHLPRTDGVTLTLVPEADVELRVEYGQAPDALLTTAIQLVPAGTRATIDLGGLRPGRSYDYLVWLRAPGEAAFTPRPLHHFDTLPARGQPTRFAVIGDTHAYALWTLRNVSIFGQTNPYVFLEHGLQQLAEAAAALDFLVVGTDTAMTKCGSCLAGSTGSVELAAGNALDADDAAARYRTVLSEQLLGRVGADLPLLFGLGDHDGELGWDADVLALSARGRRANLPDPGYWYSWRSGDVLLVMLNVHVANAVKPTAPEHWTLGGEQLAWLEQTLAASDAPLKIVLAEHLLGGHDDGTTPLWKARGGLRATDTGLPDGSFLGEQALLHELLVAHDVDLFMSFHDHVVVHGEKDGVSYLIGGRASGVEHPWADQDWYRQAMDYDLDGVPEYETEVSGTRAPGYFVISGSGRRGLAEYVLIDPEDARADGQVLLRFPFGH